jgi:hypothetical protein
MNDGRQDSGSFKGCVIEESLSDRTVLHEIQITSTRVEAVTPSHSTPWIDRWTLHQVEVPADRASEVAERLSGALDPEHGHAWYADFADATTHYVVFRDRVFKIDRSRPEQYQAAVEYGRRIGIPHYQLDFSPAIEEWRRENP